ncbi:hypothetical protein HTG_16685 [Natrinema mahii]|nr:hypothetical protein HTG_16685 [Natrinema mahii]
MRFKPVPEPPADLETVETLYRTLPPTVGDVDDCCGHLVDETPLEDREAAATWLTFLHALELAAAESGSFHRRETGSSGDAGDAVEGPLERGRLGRAFRTRVDGADAVCTTLETADEPLTVAEVVDERREDGSSDDRRRSGRPRVDPERTERLLEWAVLLGLAERAGDGYRAALARE